MAEEKLKKEYFEILLEEIKGKVQLVLEGHSVLDHKFGDLDNKIEEIKDVVQLLQKGYSVLNNKIGNVEVQVKNIDAKAEDIKKTVNEINRQLTEHMAMPAHAAV